MAARWFVAVWELQPAYVDSRREGKMRLRGSCGWVGPEVPPGAGRRAGWEIGRECGRRPGASSVHREGLKRRLLGHVRGVAHVGGAVEQDRVTVECLVLLGRAEYERSRNVHCWVG